MLIRKRSTFILCFLAIIFFTTSGVRAASDRPFSSTKTNPYLVKKTHKVNKAWLTVTNYGFFGNQDDQRYPSFEYPGGSNIEYLFQGGIWIGGYTASDSGIIDGPYVSVGCEGWAGEEEFFPGETAADSILVRSILNNDPGAISEQDFIAVYTDSMTDLSDANHLPMGLQITQSSYAWSYEYAEDFILIDYEIENTRTDGLSLANVYIGLYIDADVGHAATPSYAQDDVTGFRPFSVNPVTGDTLLVESAWITDSDGDFNFANPVTGVMGMRFLYPYPDNVSFNWWISDQEEEMDWGPSWVGEFPYGPWPDPIGTPDFDIQKYYLLSNGERNPNFCYDFDQELVENPPSGWVLCPTDCDDIADGEDTRFLYAIGPVGEIDLNDGIAIIEPGDSARITFGMFAAENFHHIGSDQKDFTDFDRNSRWAAFMYDNPNRDTYTVDTNGDGVPDMGDGFYGEDVGCDGIPNTFDSGENDHILQACEDALLPGDRDGYLNDHLELGDEIPDFDGPKPPAFPPATSDGIQFSQFIKDEAIWIKIQWTSDLIFAQDEWFALNDPLYIAKGATDNNHEFFQRYPNLIGNPTDFEGFRIYQSANGQNYNLIDEIDLIDQDYAQTVIDPGLLDQYYLGDDTGFESIIVDGDTIFTVYEDSIFTYNYGPVPPHWPFYLSVSAFDHGLPMYDLGSLETNPERNAQRIWPTYPNSIENEQLATVGFLHQNQPNPFSTQTTIHFSVRSQFMQMVGLHVYNAVGQLVRTLVQSPHTRGDYSVVWDGRSDEGITVGNGIYFYRLALGEQSAVKKMVLIR